MVIKLKSNVCIVGSGFCGYAAYRKLKEKNTDLILVEGGEIKTPKTNKEQDNYKINTNNFLDTIKGKKIKSYLDPSFRDRKFTLGGSSECWAGWIKPFEESTYQNIYQGIEEQSWGGLRLDKYHDEILNHLNSPIVNFSAVDISKKLDIKLPKLINGLDYSLYSWALEPLKLKDYWLKIINNNLYNTNNSQNIKIGYKLVDFEAENGKIKDLIFKDKNNEYLVIEANYYMLCMGGIENARFVKKLIKISPGDLENKINIGNFQEHPHLYNIGGFDQGINKLPTIMKKRIEISNAIDKSYKPGKIKLSVSAWDGPGTPKVTFTISENSKGIKSKIKNIIALMVKKDRNREKDYSITMRCEQTPNPNSKIQFNSKDTYLYWNVKDSDFEFYSTYLRRFTSFLILNNYAKDFMLSEPSTKGQSIPSTIDGGAHHMGTVPYSKDHTFINNNFRLNKYKNTYVIGTSSFPTSGFENPTHAAMATALVAADDILKKASSK